ncbi:calpain 2, (m II) large subunit [Xylographa opegraphella]|nr:calpain 2, (m II) large subunit [Xylographa opegraphella]
MADSNQLPEILSSQEMIDHFWATSLKPTKITSSSSSVLPSNVYGKLVRQHTPEGEVGGRSIAASYEKAVKECEARVIQIVAECKRNNMKYSDPHFDLDNLDYCLKGLPTASDEDASESATELCVKRVGDIFEDPHFYEGAGPQVKGIRQGAIGDCWFISTLESLCVDTESRHLIERICPERARNEKVGVYGFVFFRDGEWVSEVIDDKLYLGIQDYDDCDGSVRTDWDNTHEHIAPEVSREEYRKAYQSGSNALHFSSCNHPNETWVPLIEKAYAKAHGDFDAVARGMQGDAFEDLTGGVSILIQTANILDKDQLWYEELLQVNREFFFGAATKCYSHSDTNQKGRQGIMDNHAYSVLKAVNYKNNRLVLVKNPWGDTGWNGPWSDGSSQWTSEALKDLDHSFGNDGIFWISYADFLRRFYKLWRTRIFSPEWKVSQHWTTIEVPWSGDYNDTKFEFVLSKPGTTVIVLSKLDGRYFKGLTGQYSYNLAFRLHRSGEAVYIVRGFSNRPRSATAEVDLEAGTYEVLLQITGTRYSILPKIKDVVKRNWLSDRAKLLSIGLSYDLAHAKAQMPTSEPKDDKDTAGDAEAAKTADMDTSSEAHPQSPTTTDVSSNAAPQPIERRDGAIGDHRDGAADPSPAPADPSPAPAKDQPHTATPADNPWDARCVVGLRVYHQKQAATIRAIRQKPQAQAAVAKTKLDTDDPQKNAAEKGNGPCLEGKK